MQREIIVTVTTAATNYDLATLAEIRDELDITNGAQDARLQRYLTSASAAISQYCNRVFPAETMTEQFWAQRDRWPRLVKGGFPSLQLSRWPIQSVTSVTENGTALVEDTDFTVDAANGQLVRLDINLYPRPWPIFPIVVVYVGGFDTIPADVADAAVRMVKARYFSRDRDPMLRSENIEGVYSAQYWIAMGSQAGNMPPDIADILDNYRVPIAHGA